MDLSTASQFTEVQQQEPVDETPIAWWTFLTSPSYTLAAGMLCGIVVNFLSRNFPRQVPFHVNLPSFSLAGNSKMVLIVRTDLGMTKGKAAAQCAHAALGCYKKAVKSNAAALEAWEKTGQAKVFLNGQAKVFFYGSTYHDDDFWVYRYIISTHLFTKFLLVFFLHYVLLWFLS